MRLGAFFFSCRGPCPYFWFKMEDGYVPGSSPLDFLFDGEYGNPQPAVGSSAQDFYEERMKDHESLSSLPFGDVAAWQDLDLPLVGASGDVPGLLAGAQEFPFQGECGCH